MLLYVRKLQVFVWKNVLESTLQFFHSFVSFIESFRTICDCASKTIVCGSRIVELFACLFVDVVKRFCELVCFCLCFNKVVDKREHSLYYSKNDSSTHSSLDSNTKTTNGCSCAAGYHAKFTSRVSVHESRHRRTMNSFCYKLPCVRKACNHFYNNTPVYISLIKQICTSRHLYVFSNNSPVLN